MGWDRNFFVNLIPPHNTACRPAALHAALFQILYTNTGGCTVVLLLELPPCLLSTPAVCTPLKYHNAFAIKDYNEERYLE